MKTTEKKVNYCGTVRDPLDKSTVHHWRIGYTVVARYYENGDGFRPMGIYEYISDKAKGEIQAKIQELSQI